MRTNSTHEITVIQGEALEHLLTHIAKSGFRLYKITLSNYGDGTLQIKFDESTWSVPLASNDSNDN